MFAYETQIANLELEDKLEPELKALLAQVIEVMQDREKAFSNAEKLKALDQLFFKLHELVNDPSTRLENAQKKNELVYQIAKEILAKKDKNSYQINKYEYQRESAELGNLYNTEVILGDPKTGPSTVLMVHHDVIYVEDKDGEKIPLQIYDDGTIEGRTVQDNTIHLAMTLAGLAKLEAPERGAIIIVFTDHEENGCLGSHAYKERLAEILSPDYPVSLISLESTQDGRIIPYLNPDQEIIVGIGHRGKLDQQIISESVNDEGESVAANFCRFYESLNEVQTAAYEQGSSLIGHTVGTSTCGYINPKSSSGLQFWAKNDFRTGKAKPQFVSQRFSQNLKSIENGETLATPLDLSQLSQQVLELIQSGLIEIEITNDAILVESKSKLLHPSLFNPKKDETVLPTVYLILHALKATGEIDSLESLNWGNVKKQNSNPIEAKLSGNFSLRVENVMDLFQQFANNHYKAPQIESDDLHLQIDREKEVMTPAVEPQQLLNEQGEVQVGNLDLTTTRFLSKAKAFPTTLNFMTDIGAQYDYLSQRGFQIYPYVFGIGDPQKLHQLESVSARSRLLLSQKLPTLIQEKQELLIESTKYH